MYPMGIIVKYAFVHKTADQSLRVLEHTDRFPPGCEHIWARLLDGRDGD